MSLRFLQVSDFRSIQKLELELAPSLTLISGPNASGKTSVLEAIYFLGRGRSFRTHKTEHLIRRGANHFVLHAQLSDSSQQRSVGIQGDRAGIIARINAQKIHSLSELALELPVQAIDPEVHDLIERGPSQRRRYLDWGLFHVEPGFMDQWKGYGKALRQRNAALQTQMPKSVCDAWDSEIVRYGTRMSQMRESYVDRLRPKLLDLGRRILGEDIEVSYRRGWSADHTLDQSLIDHWASDRDRGVTQVGPHRAELTVSVHGLLARDRVSRGQQKLIAATLLLAQLELLEAQALSKHLLLLDDPSAELDAVHVGRLLEALPPHAQLILTSLDPESAALKRVVDKIPAAQTKSYALLDGKLS